MVVVYGLWARRTRPEPWRIGAFGAGCLLLVLTAVTPLDALTYHLLTAHLLQNVVLAEWAPALLVLGIPPAMAADLARLPGARLVTRAPIALGLWRIVGVLLLAALFASLLRIADIGNWRWPPGWSERLLRIGKRAVVSFPHFGHWRVRSQLLFGGKMPLTDNLPDRWYDTPNIHLCTIKDFRGLCKDVGARVERAVALNAYGRKLGVSMPAFAQNLFGEQAVFLLSR